MDGSDFGKFNTRLVHKQKTRKINLGRWEEAESQAVDFGAAGAEPVRPREWVLGSAAAQAVLGVLGVLRAGVPGSGHRAPGWAAADGGREQPPLCCWSRAGGEGQEGHGNGWCSGSPRATRWEQHRCPLLPIAARPGDTVEGKRVPCLVPFHVEAGNTWLQQ